MMLRSGAELSEVSYRMSHPRFGWRRSEEEGADNVHCFVSLVMLAAELGIRRDGP